MQKILIDQVEGLQTSLDNKVSQSLATTLNDLLMGNAGGTAFEAVGIAAACARMTGFFDTVYALISQGVTNGDSHNHVGGDGAALSYSDVLGAFFNGVSIPATTTYYGCPFKVGVDGTTNSFPWPDAGTLSNMSVRISVAQPGTGTMVATLAVNGSPTALVVTIAAGAAAGTYTDNTHTVTINAGDTVRWDIVNNASSGGANLTAASMKLTKQTT